MNVRQTVGAESGWIALTVAGSVAPLLAVLAAGYTLSWRDTSQLFEPMRGLISESLRSGRLPLWNPYEAAGVPLFAQVLHGVLHPWSVLAALVAPEGGVDLLIVLHVASGAVGAGVLARSIGAPRAGAAIAGLGYGLSGYLLGLSGILQYLAAGGTAPWAIAALRRAAFGGWARISLGALALGILFLAGDPQWAIVASALAAWLAWEARGAAGLGRQALAAVLGVALAAVQLAPGWWMLGETTRGLGLSAADRTQWALSPARLIEFVVPGFFAGVPGPALAPVFLWFDGPSPYPLPYLPSVFVGLPVLLLALLGARASRPGRWLAAAAVALLWVALGHRVGSSQVLGWIPVWGSFRYSEKLVGPLTLMLAVLAGLGLGPLTERSRPRAARLAAATALLLAVAAAVTFALSHASEPPTWPAEVWHLVTGRGAAGLLLATLTPGALAISRSWQAAGTGDVDARRALATRLVAVTLVTGLAAAPASLHAGRADSRDPRPLAFLPGEGNIPRIVQPVDVIELSVARGFDMFDASQALRSRIGRPPYNVPSRIDGFVVYSGLLPRRYGAVIEHLDELGPARWIAYRRFSVSHAVLTPALTSADAAAAESATAGGQMTHEDGSWGISLWSVPHEPWARFAQHVHSVGSEREAIAAMMQSLAAGDRSVILEGAAPVSLSGGQVLAVQRGTDLTRIVAEAPAPGLLVVADAWWPGWEALIDGRPVPILCADGMLRAVAWPAGRHVLDMHYRPPEVRAGLLVSAATAMLLLGAAIWDGTRRHRG